MKVLNILLDMQKAAGTSVFCGELSNGLVDSGHDVTLAVVSEKKGSDFYDMDDRVKVVSIRSVISGSEKFDVVHIHGLWAPALHKVARWARLNRLPLVWSPHGMMTPWAMGNKKLKKMLGWWVYQKHDLSCADLIHATAQSEVNDIRMMGLNNKVIIAPLGVRVDCASGHAGEESREKILLFVSRVQRKKGLLNLVQAWAQLPAHLKIGWKVKVVGPDQEGHTDEVREECNRFDVLKDWEFAGPKFGDELRAEYRLASLFVLPTHSENFGSVVIEALAQSLPVITTKGAPWSCLEERRCGWWVDIGIAPLVKALKEAMSLPDETLQSMGERGRKLVEERFTWPVVVEKILEGYREVLNGRT